VSNTVFAVWTKEFFPGFSTSHCLQRAETHNEQLAYPPSITTVTLPAETIREAQQAAQMDCELRLFLESHQRAEVSGSAFVAIM
jgi:hypothetical protein